uniref:Uncharacterized protein n=2 Tax=Panagrolaimus sp. JU765 TaxID=591449 RepID=A0AC34RAK9_9BILA
MSSLNAKHEFDALVKRLPFDINPAFYPPPTLSLLDIKISPPSDYKYDFKNELEAIEMYKEDQINNPELELNDSTQQTHRPTVIDIISKVSYLSIANSNNTSQSQAGTVPSGTIANSEASSASTTPPVANQLKYPDPASTAAAMLPTWTPPQLI